MPKNFLKQVRESIKDEKGKILSCQKLADRIGNISASALSQFENGKAALSMDTIQKIMFELKVSYEQLMISGINPEDPRLKQKDKKLLLKTMNLAHDHYGDLDREKVIEIAAEIYDILAEFYIIKNDERDDFMKSQEEKIIAGLAPKSFLFG